LQLPPARGTLYIWLLAGGKLIKQRISACAPVWPALIAFMLGIAFALGACARAYAQSNDPEALNKQVIELYRVGQYAAAVPLAERYAEEMKSRYGAEAPQYATALNNLAELYRAHGRYADAEPLYQRAIAITEKTLGRDNPDVGIRLNNLALLYQAQGRYADAEPLYQRSLAITEKALGPDNPTVGTALNYRPQTKATLQHFRAHLTATTLDEHISTHRGGA